MFDPKDKIREMLDRETRGMEAFVIMKAGKAVARIVIRGRPSSEGRTVRAWVHYLGTPMVMGEANGGNYDMVSAACDSAMDMAEGAEATERAAAEHDLRKHRLAGFEEMRACGFMGALREATNELSTWENRLRDAGFTVERAL